MIFDLPRRMFAEALGTALLVCSVVGSGIMSAALTGDGAVALLANSMVTGAMLAVLITVFGPISGGHINPALTLAFALRRELPPGDAAAYVVAQICGAVLGTMAANVMFSVGVIEVSQSVRSGPALWFSETLSTFILIGIILVSLRFRPSLVPALVGLYIACAIWFTSSSSYANPAGAIGRSLSDSYIGIRPADLPAFITAHLLGSVLAVAVFGWLLRPATVARQTEGVTAP